MTGDWEETRKTFRRIAAKEGIRRIAGEVPAHHATIYRLIRGDTQEPSRAVRAGIERVVREQEEGTND